MKTILHITTQGAWDSAQRDGVYLAASLASEGFIHCSTLRQTVATANAFFRGANDLVLLLIDESAVSSPVKYEPPAGAGHERPGDLFPHIHGPLNLTAVIRVIDFPPDADGTFRLPKIVDE